MRYEQSDGQSMVTSRSVPQQTAQIFSPLAGQKRAGLRLSQIGQDTQYPLPSRIIEQDTLRRRKRQKRRTMAHARMRYKWKPPVNIVRSGAEPGAEDASGLIRTCPGSG